MNKEQLQARLDAINANIQENIAQHNDLVKEKEAQVQEKIAHHNMLIGRRDEIADLLANLDNPQQ